MPISPTNHMMARKHKEIEKKEKNILEKIHDGIQTVERLANKGRRILSIINEK